MIANEIIEDRKRVLAPFIDPLKAFQFGCETDDEYIKQIEIDIVQVGKNAGIEL